MEYKYTSNAFCVCKFAESKLFYLVRDLRKDTLTWVRRGIETHTEEYELITQYHLKKFNINPKDITSLG